MHIGKAVINLKRVEMRARTLLMLLSRRKLAAHSSARRQCFSPVLQSLYEYLTQNGIGVVPHRYFHCAGR